MSKNSPSKEGTLEALDFILNIIRDHDKDLEQLTNKLASIAKKGDEKGEIKEKLDRIENDLSNLQNDIAKLAKILSVSGKRS